MHTIIKVLYITSIAWIFKNLGHGSIYFQIVSYLTLNYFTFLFAIISMLNCEPYNWYMCLNKIILQ